MSRLLKPLFGLLLLSALLLTFLPVSAMAADTSKKGYAELYVTDW